MKKAMLVFLTIFLVSCSNSEKDISNNIPYLESFPARKDGLNETKCRMNLYMSKTPQSEGVYAHDEYAIIQTISLVYDDQDMPIEGYWSTRETIFADDPELIVHFEYLMRNAIEGKNEWKDDVYGREVRYTIIDNDTVLEENRFIFTEENLDSPQSYFLLKFIDEKGNEYYSAKKTIESFNNENSVCKNAGD